MGSAHFKATMTPYPGRLSPVHRVL